MKPLLLVAAVLAALGAGFLLLRGSDPNAGAPGTSKAMVTRSESPTGVRTSDAQAADLTAVETGSLDQASRTAEALSLDRDGATLDGAARGNLDPASTKRIIVDLLLPPGAALSEDFRIIAFSESDPEADASPFGDDAGMRRFRRRSSGQAAIESLMARESDEEVRFSIHRVEPGAREVEVLFDGDAAVGSLMVADRFLYLEEPLDLALEVAESRVTLEPKAGAWISGEVAVPSGHMLSPMEDGSYGTATLAAATLGRGRGRRSRNDSVELGEDLRFDFFAVDPELAAEIRIDVPKLAPGTFGSLALNPGAKTDCSLTLVPGATLRGRVLDPGGQPVAKVTVTASVSGNMWARRGSRAERAAVTDKSGRFEILGLGDGTYRAKATRDGWRNSQSKDEVEIAGGTSAAGAIEIRMDQGRTITGRVLLPGGQGAGGAELNLVQSSPPAENEGRGGWGRPRATVERESVTADEDGRFEFVALGDTEAVIRASYQGPPAAAAGSETAGETSIEALVATVEGVEPANPGESEPIEIRLAPTLTIRGRVLDDAGEPLTRFTVRARRAGSETLERAGGGVTQAFEDASEGHFAATGAGAGTWRVSISGDGFDSPDDQTQTVELPQEGGPLLFSMRRQGLVRGTVVTPQGVPVPGASVQIPRGGGFGGMGRGRSVSAGGEGTFRYANLSAGQQELVATAEGWAESLPVSVTVQPGAATEGIVLTLREGGIISGTVRDDDGNPWEGRRVTYASGGGPIAMFGGQATADTDASGRFTFEHVPPGKWTVNASPGEAEMMETMRGADMETGFFELLGKNLTEEVVVVDGETVTVELGAEPRDPVTVTGTVTRDGDPVEEGSVTFTREGGELFSSLKRATLSGDGTYSLELDRPGAYIISVERDLGRNQFFGDVKSGEQQQMDFALPAGGIAGRVMDAGGEPAQGIRVTAEPEASMSFARFDLRSSVTDEEGRYEIPELDAGTYAVRFGAPAFGRGGGGGGSALGVSMVGKVAVTQEEMTRGVDVRLAGAGRVKGEVVDAEGAPVAGATVFVRDPSGRSIASVSRVTTDPSGSFTYDRVAPGTYTVSVRSADGAAPDVGGVVVQEGEDAEVRLVMEPATTLLISTLDEEGEPVRATLSVKDADDREVTGLMGFDFFRSLGEGVSTSEQKVGPLPPGRYTVYATAKDGRTERKRVTVRDKAESRVRVKFKD